MAKRALEAIRDTPRSQNELQQDPMNELLKQIRGMAWGQEDIISLQDLILSCLKIFLDEEIWHQCRNTADALMLAENLLWLVQPVEEELLHPEGPNDKWFWEAFAAERVQRMHCAFLLPMCAVFFQVTRLVFQKTILLSSLLGGI